MVVVRTPSIVKGNNPLNLVWSKWGSQCRLLSWIWKALQCVAISHWSSGFSANEEYWNISLKAYVSLSLIGACCIHQFVWMKYQDQVGPGTRILSNPSSRGASGDQGNRPGHNCNKIRITSILRKMTTATTRCIHSSPPGPGHHGVASCYPLLRWKLLFSFIQTRINSFCTEPLHLC